MKNIKGKGNLFEGEGGGRHLKEDLRYFHLMFISMNAFSLCHICLRERGTFSYCGITLRNKLESNAY